MSYQIERPGITRVHLESVGITWHNTIIRLLQGHKEILANQGRGRREWQAQIGPGSKKSKTTVVIYLDDEQDDDQGQVEGDLYEEQDDDQGQAEGVQQYDEGGVGCNSATVQWRPTQRKVGQQATARREHPHLVAAIIYRLKHL